MAVNQNPDVTLPELVRPSDARAPDSWRLSILYHPQTDRIGRVHQWPVKRNAECILSRHSPLFGDLRGGQEGALDDPYISRSACVLQQQCDGLLLTRPPEGSSLMVGQTLVSGDEFLNADMLEQGVLLTLARRVVLLLQKASYRDRLPPEFGMVGESETLQRARESIELASGCDLPVLLLGQSGSGKELAARAIHANSHRARESLVSVNAAAIPADLASAEFFGVRRGAFTGADSDRIGYFEQADGGSLFLDEIGECPAPVQAQLLRALESGDIQLAGGLVRQVDVRMIAATDAALEEGALSTALRHRLGGIEVRMPALSARREDIGRLVAKFLRDYESLQGCCLHRAEQDPLEAVQWAVWIRELAERSWPGNVRELRNHCEQVFRASHAQGALAVPQSSSIDSSDSVAEPLAVSETRKYRPPRDVSVEEIAEALAASRYQLAAAARALNISRPSLYNRLQSMPQLHVAADLPAEEVMMVYDQCAGDLAEAARRMCVSEPALLRRWHAMELEARPQR